MGQKRWRHRYNSTSSGAPSSSGKGRAKSVKGANAVHDVYEFQPSRNRRGGISLLLDEDELRGASYNDEDELHDEEDRARRNPRLIGEGEEDEQIGSDEDEEIESDAAFDESDEDQFAGSSFKQKKLAKSGKGKPGKSGRRVPNEPVNLAEDGDGMREDDTEGDEIEEEEGEASDFLDVLDVLDGRATPYLEDEENTPEPKNDRLRSSTRESKRDSFEEGENKNRSQDSDSDSDEGEDDSVDNHSDKESQISASDGEDDETALEALGQFVSGLETGAKRKAPDDEEKEQDSVAGHAKKKKRSLKDRTESGVENEFNASAAGTSKLSLDDLLTPLASRQGVLTSLKKSVKPLADSSNPKNQPLPAPLPTRTQEKLERQAAYEQTKQEVDKWTDTMKRIEEAEHLSFPLQAPRTTKVSNLELTAKFKPTTELESSIDRLLKSAKLHEDEINKTEDLMMKDLTVEEVAARRAELRKMRELAFRADTKAKRIAKIKSKTYRRIHKKERAKLMANIDTSAGRSGIDEDEERLKAETERARERATLRHKNTGKWAKAMKARGELDVDQRRDINEMLERGERLRRRIQGVGSGGEDESDSSGSDQYEETGDGIARLKAAAFEELKKIQGEDEGDEETENRQKAKGVFQMKFMKDAAVRKNAALDREIDDFRREMADWPERNGSDDGDDVNTEVTSPAERVHGRMVFRPGPQNQSSMLPPPPPSALSALSETSTLRSHDSPVVAFYDESNSTPSPKMCAVAAPAISEPSNPWLAEPSSSLKVTRRKNELIIGKNVSREQKSEAALQKQVKKGTDERMMGRDDAAIDIATDDVLLLNKHEESEGGATAPVVSGKGEGDRKKGRRKKDKKGKGKEKPEEQSEGDDSEANSEIDEQETALRKGKKVTAFEQRDLVARAFAGDNVVRQFADEKRKEIEALAPREVDTTLQGWGSWGGAGTKKAAPKPHLIKKVAGIDPKSRADYGKAHVIISERRDKKALRFAVKDLPYPYTSKAQFEARMSTPVGAEWNTRLGFQRGTLPRVVKKMGTIIDPLEKV